MGGIVSASTTAAARPTTTTTQDDSTMSTPPTSEAPPDEPTHTRSPEIQRHSPAPSQRATGDMGSILSSSTTALASTTTTAAASTTTTTTTTQEDRTMSTPTTSEAPPDEPTHSSQAGAPMPKTTSSSAGQSTEHLMPRRSPRKRGPIAASGTCSSLLARETTTTTVNQRKRTTAQAQQQRRQRKTKTDTHTKFRIPRRPQRVNYETDADNRKQLGNETMGMCLLYPPCPEPPAVALVRQLDALLQTAVVKKELLRILRNEEEEEAANDKDDFCESIRRIQGGRLEIFLHSRGKTSAAFDQVLGRRLAPNHETKATTTTNCNETTAKQVLLDYCCDQASRDPRLQRGYALDTFSLLVNFGPVPAQAPHIDMVHPNFQFGLVCSEHAPSTMFVQNSDSIGHVQTVEQLQELWQANPAFSDDKFPQGMPQGIVQALQSDAGALQLLRYFGDTLLPEATLQHHLEAPQNLPVGTLVSLPGGIVHCGPESTRHRSILFFSGTPSDGQDEIDAYLPDSQYSGVTLTVHLASILWRKDGVAYREREYLLRKLRQYVLGCYSHDVLTQLQEGPMREFVDTIHSGRYKNDSAACDEFIHETSKRTDMAFTQDPFSETEREIDVSGMQAVSAERGLYTLWEEEGGYQKELQVALYYRKSDEKYILRYRTEGKEDTNPDEYEGHNPNEKLTLQRAANWKKSDKFDGTNGTLLDTDGEPIVIYKGKRHGGKLPAKKRKRTKA